MGNPSEHSDLDQSRCRIALSGEAGEMYQAIGMPMHLEIAERMVVGLEP